MADDLQTVGTTLRRINDELQRIVPMGTEATSVNKTKGKAILMVEELNALDAGAEPDPDSSQVIPTTAFLAERKAQLLDADQQIDPSSVVDELKRRINTLKSAVGKTQGRDV